MICTLLEFYFSTQRTLIWGRQYNKSKTREEEKKVVFLENEIKRLETSLSVTVHWGLCMTFSCFFFLDFSEYAEGNVLDSTKYYNRIEYW
jgi:hypothetical protein